MRRISVLLVMIVLLAPMVVDAGDPLDTNDTPKVMFTTGTVDQDCSFAEKYPYCNPCWTSCMYSIMAEAWSNGLWDWGW